MGNLVFGEVCSVNFNINDSLLEAGEQIDENEGGTCMNVNVGKVILYGAGTQNLRMAYQPLVSSGCKIDFICDRDREKQGKRFNGIEIIAPEKLSEVCREENAEIIITVRTPKVVEEIKKTLLQIENATVYTFEEFVQAKKLNGKVKRFSCIMAHLTDHCNLSCVRCSHFSPLAQKEFYVDAAEFEKDCRRLTELTGGDIDEFQLSGGEPLLHPEAAKFPYIVRKYLKDTQIIIITNAIKLKSMPEEFFRSCRDNKVNVWISQYPLQLPYEDLRRELEDKGISVTFGNTGNSKDKPKEMWGLPLKLAGGLDSQENFDACLCMQYIIRHGRLYPCANSAYIDLFNNYFNKKLPGPEINGVDIYSVKNLQELCEAISKPIALCEYCDACNRMPPIPWCASHKTIEEWSL